jgi:glutaredoxin
MSNDYYLHLVILKDCPYGKAAHELLNSYKNIKKEFTYIERNDIEKYKTDLIKTYPQIYLKRYNTNGTQLIGGYSDIKKIIDTFNKKYDKETMNNYLNENKNISRKSMLRLIELLNT